MSMDHLQNDPDKRPAATEPGGAAPINSALRVAFERLIDQFDPLGAAEEPALRTARRVCGRWLMLRRLSRHLAPPMLALRTGIDESAITLLELGLLDRHALPESAWERLCLVLEAPANDLERVAQALRVVSGLDTQPDVAMLQQLEGEVGIAEATAPFPVQAPEQAVARVATPHSAAPPAVQPRILSDEGRGILEALAGSDALTLTGYSVKKWLEQQRRISLSPAVLPLKLEALMREGLVLRGAGQPYVYTITQEGQSVLALELSRMAVQQEQGRLDSQALDLKRRKPSLFGV